MGWLRVVFRWRRRHERHLAEYRQRLEQAQAAAPPSGALIPAIAPPRGSLSVEAEDELPSPARSARAMAVRAEDRDRAAMLADRARQLSRSGRHTEASAPARAAVRILGELAEHNPAEHAAALVDALRALAAVLAGGKQYADAVKVADNATLRARRLAALDVHLHRPLLAATLRDLGARLGDAGEAIRALSVLHECVEAYRTLAARSPEVYRAGLADALDEFAGRLAESGLTDDALAVFEEAARLLTLADADVLAQVTTRQANLLARVGRVDEALERANSAVRLRRSQAEDAPGAAEDALAAALQSYGLLLSGTKRHDDAVEALEEAVSLRARRVRVDPAIARRPEVAVTYAVYGLVLISADRPADAVPPLAAALGVGTALNLPQVVEMATDALIRAHAAEPAAVRSRWRAATGEDAPQWITGTGRTRRVEAGPPAPATTAPRPDRMPAPDRTPPADRPPRADRTPPPDEENPRPPGRGRLTGQPMRRPIPSPTKRPRTDVDV
ncbi:hypothetical protein GCM10023205_13940 [Yinghuangia aomiensis]|uniref:Tetratricopeptide repeat-containing protein n=2 Tax=Yinghuangia aomiensis TaxID=676205 RepID=A0ABP9GUC4_9ACTN